MSEWSAASEIELLEFHRRVQVQDLARTDHWLAEARQRETEEELRRERAAQPPPEWVAARDRAQGTVTVHTTLGDRADICWGIKVDHVRTKAINRAQALQALTTDGATPCDKCRPDTVLGVLE
ncbi:DUF6233 domain-containing protein [Streptomyces sp. NBC_01471]|uniref:DUF6233 domain-containing protein n=1 Tax=Streptomyces sp. NBC_01471 TaxID=2903879 RepID=UPI00324EB0F8